MSTPLELMSAKVNIAKSGLEGSMALMPIVANKIVTTTNMIVGAYSIAANPVVPAYLSITVSAVTGNDTMGTITFVGTDANGLAQTEIVTPVAAGVAYSTKVFKTVTTATGAGWVINTGNDTIVIGTMGLIAPTGYFFSSFIIMAATVVASMTPTTGTHVPYELFATIPVGTYPLKATVIALTSGQAMVTLARL